MSTEVSMEIHKLCPPTIHTKTFKLVMVMDMMTITMETTGRQMKKRCLSAIGGGNLTKWILY